MRRLLMLAALLQAGCECGPGVACKVDDDCGGWGRCIAVSGGAAYCAQSTQDTDGGNDGTPRAAMSQAALELGLVPCGRAPVTKSVTLTNAGGGTLNFAAATGTSNAFSVSPAQGALAPDASVDLVIAGSAPSSASAGVESLGQLVVTTSDPAHPRFEVPLSLRAAGVTLTLTPGLASFGVGPVGAAAPGIPLTLTNTGNVAATVTVAQPGDAQFSLTWSGAPQSLSLAAGMSADGLTANFTPTKTSPSSSGATLSVAEAVCGASAVSIPMTGQGTNGSVGLSTTDVFFGTGGLVNCGATSPNRTLTLRNTGNQPYAWTVTLGRSTASPFNVSPSSGTVPANGGQATLTISTTAIPAEASTAAEAFGDTLFVATDVANDPGHAITLHQTANGARLSFAPPAVDFGLVRVGGSATAGFSIVNDGNAPAHVLVATVNPKFTLPGGLTTAPGATSTPLMAGYAPGSSTGDDTATGGMTVDAADVLCAPLPAGLLLSGTGTNGSVSYAPASLDFGVVNCGTTAAARTVSFKNDGNQTYTVSAALGHGASSAYTFALAPADGVAAVDGGTVVVTVTPKAVPSTSPVTANYYGDTLTVTTDVAGDTPHDVPLRETARGAIFSLSASSLSFGSVAVGVSASAQFSVTNNGNAPGTLTFAPVQPTIFTLPATAAVGAGASSVLSGQFAPANPTVYSDSAAVGTTGTVLCAPLPSTTLALDGTGTNSNVVMLSAASVTFGAGGLTNCGTTATPKTVDVTNNSSQTLSLALSLLAGAASPYTVSGSGAVDAGTTVTVTVTPKAVPAQLPDGGAVSTALDGFADALRVHATGGLVDETHTVTLHQTAQGAIVTFNPTAITITGTPIAGSKFADFTVNNAGNVPAPYTLTLTGTNWGLSPTSGTTTASSAPTHRATFSNPLLGGGAKTGSIHYVNSGSAVMCAPLPANLTLSGS